MSMKGEVFSRFVDKVAVERYARESMPQRLELLADYLRIDTPPLPKMDSMPQAPLTQAGDYDGVSNVLRMNFKALYAPTTPFSKAFAHLTFEQDRSAGRALDHELVHYLTDVIAEKNDADTFMKTAKPKDVMGRLLLIEGIAQFVESRGEDCEAPIRWPTSWNSIDFYTSRIPLLYEGGCSIVAPIIEKYRGEGIRYLVQHPVAFESPQQLPNYQARALRDLEHMARENL